MNGGYGITKSNRKEKQVMKRVLAILVGVMVASGAMAQSKPLQLSITPDIAIFDRGERIEGLTIGLWSQNPQTALALGIANGSTGRSAGMSLALILNYADSYEGIQWASINYTKVDFLGWQGGLVNYTDGTMKGLQTGVVNYAGRLTGLQFGFVNYAVTAENGVQLGLINLIPRNPWFTGSPNELAPGMIFFNWRF
jgi:hypothetical protein